MFALHTHCNETWRVYDSHTWSLSTSSGNFAQASSIIWNPDSSTACFGAMAVQSSARFHIQIDERRRGSYDTQSFFHACPSKTLLTHAPLAERCQGITSDEAHMITQAKHQTCTGAIFHFTGLSRNKICPDPACEPE